MAAGGADAAAGNAYDTNNNSTSSCERCAVRNHQCFSQLPTSWAHVAELPGKSLGKYEVVKHLAEGGAAQVLIARTHGLKGFERHVVIKRIAGEHARDAEFVRMFLDEARVTATLHHQNIVQVHDIGEHDGEYFYAMEYVHGEDLRKVLKRAFIRGEPFPLGHALKIMIGACSGLHHAHEHHGPDQRPLGLVHRDVCPANILVGYDGSVKIATSGSPRQRRYRAER